MHQTGVGPRRTATGSIMLANCQRGRQSFGDAHSVLQNRVANGIPRMVNPHRAGSLDCQQYHYHDEYSDTVPQHMHLGGVYSQVPPTGMAGGERHLSTSATGIQIPPPAFDLASANTEMPYVRQPRAMPNQAINTGAYRGTQPDHPYETARRCSTTPGARDDHDHTPHDANDDNGRRSRRESGPQAEFQLFHDNDDSDYNADDPSDNGEDEALEEDEYEDSVDTKRQKTASGKWQATGKARGRGHEDDVLDENQYEDNIDTKCQKTASGRGQYLGMAWGRGRGKGSGSKPGCGGSKAKTAAGAQKKASNRGRRGQIAHQTRLRQ